MDFSNNRIDTQRRTAVYVRISTSMQKTDRQIEELVTFAKENKLNFNDKNDIGTQIMIQVLAVLSQYEIELFIARGIDGKITAFKTRGSSNGGPGPYGRLVHKQLQAHPLLRQDSPYHHGETSRRKEGIHFLQL